MTVQQSSPSISAHFDMGASKIQRETPLWRTITVLRGVQAAELPFSDPGVTRGKCRVRGAPPERLVLQTNSGFASTLRGWQTQLA